MSQPGEMPRTDVDAAEADPSEEIPTFDGGVPTSGGDEAGADTARQREDDELQMESEGLSSSLIADVFPA